LLERLKAWKIRLYGTDDCRPYDSPLPARRHSIGKDETYQIEPKCRQRHWFARLGRKSLVVTRSLEMLEPAMRLFAAFHVNGSDERVLSMIG
jgi:insertion element IS1 protein InsB